MEDLKIDKIPFPQADDMEKIFKIINIIDENDLFNKKYMCIILGDISNRQVQYYLNAAMYLNIIDAYKHFTEFGRNLKNLNVYEQKIQIARKIISDEIFGEVYFTEKILGVKLSKYEIIEIMKKHLNYKSEAIYLRRAQTVRAWIEWINKHDLTLNKKQQNF